MTAGRRDADDEGLSRASTACDSGMAHSRASGSFQSFADYADSWNSLTVRSLSAGARPAAAQSRRVHSAPPSRQQPPKKPRPQAFLLPGRHLRCHERFAVCGAVRRPGSASSQASYDSFVSSKQLHGGRRTSARPQSGALREAAVQQTRPNTCRQVHAVPTSSVDDQLAHNRMPRRLHAEGKSAGKYSNTALQESPRRVHPVQLDSPKRVHPVQLDSPRRVHPVQLDSPRRVHPVQLESPKRVHSTQPDSEADKSAAPSESARPPSEGGEFAVLRQIGVRRPRVAFQELETPASGVQAATEMRRMEEEAAAVENSAGQRQQQQQQQQTRLWQVAPNEWARAQPATRSGRAEGFRISEEPETAVRRLVETEQQQRRQQQQQQQQQIQQEKQRQQQQQQQQQQLQQQQRQQQRQFSTAKEPASGRRQNIFVFAPGLPGNSRRQTQQQQQQKQQQKQQQQQQQQSQQQQQRQPVLGYNWLQEFNRMSVTEAEIERRVRNGGRLRHAVHQATRFELPFDLHELEGMDPKDYLRQYSIISTRRTFLYQKVFQKHRNTSVNAVEVKELGKAIGDIIVGGISEEKLDELLDLTCLKGAGHLDSKLFFAFCAVVERQTTGQKVPDDASELMDGHKQKLESADFFGLAYKFRGLRLSEEMQRLLRSL